MERIAVISDIHGNLPALEAVLSDIKSKSADRIICLGDIIGKGPNMKETIDICKSSCEAIIKGNWEDYICTHPENQNYNWHRDEIGVERLSFLSTLPLKIEFFMSGKLVRLFHAHPKDLYKRVFPSNSMEEKLEMFSYSEDDSEVKYKRYADIIGYGDIHTTFIQNFNNKVLFNVGSVGNSLDIPLASYVLMEGTYDSKIESSYSIQFCRVPFDKDLAIAYALGSEMPKKEAYIKEILTAVYSR